MSEEEPLCLQTITSLPSFLLLSCGICFHPGSSRESINSQKKLNKTEMKVDQDIGVSKFLTWWKVLHASWVRYKQMKWGKTSSLWSTTRKLRLFKWAINHFWPSFYRNQPNPLEQGKEEKKLLDWIKTLSATLLFFSSVRVSKDGVNFYYNLPLLYFTLNAIKCDKL